jgi:hypothetical protein
VIAGGACDRSARARRACRRAGGSATCGIATGASGALRARAARDRRGRNKCRSLPQAGPAPTTKPRARPLQQGAPAQQLNLLLPLGEVLHQGALAEDAREALQRACFTADVLRPSPVCVLDGLLHQLVRWPRTRMSAG